MEEYNRLLNKINMYFGKNKVSTTDNIISLYDLYVLLKNELQILEEKKYCLLKDMQYNEVVKRDKNKLININIHSNTNEIVMTFSYLNKKTKEISFKVITKKYNCKDIDFNNTNLDKNLIELYYDKIMSIFAIKELHHFVYKLSIEEVKEKIVDDLFDIDIIYNKYGINKLDIKIKKEEDSNDTFNREWFLHKSLKEIVDDYKLEIFKRIPVDISRLHEVTKTIVIENNLTKTKVRIKKKNL